MLKKVQASAKPHLLFRIGVDWSEMVVVVDRAEGGAELPALLRALGPHLGMAADVLRGLAASAAAPAAPAVAPAAVASAAAAAAAGAPAPAAAPAAVASAAAPAAAGAAVAHERENAGAK